METAQTTSGYELKSELARFCLPAANRDSDRKLAWVNSICLLFILIGLAGARSPAIRIKRPPPIEQVIPVVVEPAAPPPTRVEARENQEQNDQDKPDAPRVVVTLESPAIHFSVPTIGSLVVPNALAQAPPIAPLKSLAAVRNQPSSINSTGTGGDRPQPRYPKLAQDLGQQGTVLLSMTVDETGVVTAVEIKESSGSPILDRSALEFVKRHWILPPGAAGRIYEAPIRYVLGQ